MLTRAIETILACPACYGPLGLEMTKIVCRNCRKEYPIVDGIPVFFTADFSMQEQERAFRDGLPFAEIENAETLMQIVGEHHSPEAMRPRIESFISEFARNQWILDIGTGFGWHWKDAPSNASILAVDFSMTNLRAARVVLGAQENVLLICADATRLPLAPAVISGVWSVQVFQHFSEEVFQKVSQELQRVIQAAYFLEIVDLNPAWFARKLFKRRGIPIHLKGEAENFLLNRRTEKEQRSRWSAFPGKLTFQYSELFFHAPVLRPAKYPEFTEALVSRIPFIRSVLAGQLHVKIRPVKT